MKAHALILASLLLSTGAHAWETDFAENPGPHTVRKDQPACMNVADWDRIQSYARDTKNPLERARAPRAFQELTDADHPQVGGGRVCTMIPKGTKVTVEKRYGTYECVRYQGQPPRYYEKTCIWTNAVSSYKDLNIPNIDWYWY